MNSLTPFSAALSIIKSRAGINVSPPSNEKVLPVIIHGDAAVAGQGVVYEVAQMERLKGYSTSGTIHIVVNNQVGFTTNYIDGRSSTYCTDVGKVNLCPILHVNADDVEAVIHAANFALEYRMKLKEMFLLIFWVIEGMGIMKVMSLDLLNRNYINQSQIILILNKFIPRNSLA